MKKFLLLFYGMSLAAACLITNCPRGGKRGFVTYLEKLVEPKQELKVLSHQCIKCGPGADGLCVGPDICCGPRLGCLIASPGITSQCSRVSFTPPSSAPTCLMSSGLGICAVDGICCNSESCRIEQSCEVDLYSTLCPIDITESDDIHLKY